MSRIDELAKMLGWEDSEIAEFLDELKQKLETTTTSAAEDTATEKVTPPLELRIANLLHKLGMPAHTKGYPYVKEAIAYCFNDSRDPSSINITKEIYPAVAECKNTTPLRVERSIRHIIEVTWKRGNTTFIDEVFGNSIDPEKGKPTNREFIALLVDYLNLGSDLK